MKLVTVHHTQNDSHEGYEPGMNSTFEMVRILDAICDPVYTQSLCGGGCYYTINVIFSFSAQNVKCPYMVSLLLHDVTISKNGDVLHA